jgi:hypothetical protein
MAKSSTSPSSSGSAKKSRQRKPASFIARIEGDDPIIVVAHSYKDALKAVITLTPASAADLMAAGRNSYKVIDTTAPVVKSEPMFGEAA